MNSIQKRNEWRKDINANGSAVAMRNEKGGDIKRHLLFKNLSV